MKYILAVYCYVLLLSQCKYDNTVDAQKLKVPDYTETGASTFGANIGDAIWVNFGKTKINKEITSYYEDNVVNGQITYNYTGPKDSTFIVSGRLNVWSKGKSVRDEDLNFVIKKIYKSFKGSYLLGSKNTAMHYTKQSTGDYYNPTEYNSMDRNPIKLTVRADSTIKGKHVIAGVFDGYLFHTERVTLAVIDSVHVTAGVFDVTIGN